MLLYNSQVSGNCYKVRLILAHRGLIYDRHELDVVDRSNRADVIGDRNPALRVPTIVLDDGRPLAESNAILHYFAEGTDLLPSDPYEHAQVLQWMFFEQYQHEPNLAVARFLILVRPGPPPEPFLSERLEGSHQALGIMEQYLASHEFFVGERYTIADIALYAYTHVAHEAGIDLAEYPAIGRWIERVAAQPGHVTIDA